jgi:hypothetical protein
MLGLCACASGVGAQDDAQPIGDAPPFLPSDAPPASSMIDAAATVDAPVVLADAGPDAAPDPLIDDFEDGDGWIRMVDGRSGAWFTYNDGTGTQTPAATADFLPVAGGPGTSRFCAHTSGSGFTTWGAGLGFDLATPAFADGGTPMRASFDAARYSGIAFAAKGNVSIRVMVVTTAVEPPSAGGTCQAGAQCEDAHGLSVALSANWTQVMVPFAQLAQDGWGQPFAFDARTLLGVEFQVAAGTSFDFSIDDVRFY